MITSRTNPTIKSIRALRDRKERERTQLFFVEGIRLVAEAVQLKTQIQSIIVAPDLLKSDFARDIIAQAQSQGAQRIDVNADVFASLSDKEGPQGLAAVVHQRWTNLSNFIHHPSCLILALESPQDPGNIGTILRTADATAVDAIILLGQPADPYDPDAVRASMGALFNQTLIKNASFADVYRWAQKNKITLIGTSDKASIDYRLANYQQATMLLMGSERQGITQEQTNACDQLVRIPMQGRSDSLNLAIATGILLYETHRQRHPIATQ